MATNKGLQFEWCIYYKVRGAIDPTRARRDPVFMTSQAEFKKASKEVKDGANKAIALLRKQFGDITKIQKISGGDEPKTDLIIWAGGKKLKCSLKFGKSVQLSSGGVKNTVKFLTGVLELLKKREGYNKKQITQIISTLAKFEESHGEIGKLPRAQIDEHFAKAEQYDMLLKTILGSRKEPKVSEEYDKIKLAIVEEAMTGKYTFGGSDKTANHILSNYEIKKITPKFIREVADKTSVRLALKGRGKQVIAGEVVRLNEIVVRFDTG